MPMPDDAHRYSAVLAKMGLAAVLAIGWCWTQRFGGCEISDLSEGVKLGLSLTADSVKLLLTLSTTLAALGGAVMLGLKETPKLGPVDRILLLASMCCFVFSAYFALLWQSQLAELYY